MTVSNEINPEEVETFVEFILDGVDLTKNGEEETVFELSVKINPHINTSTESTDVNTNPPCSADDISILVTLIYLFPNLRNKVEQCVLCERYCYSFVV